MSVYVDVKKTVWERYYLKDTVDANKIKQILEDHEDYELIIDDEYFEQSEILFNTLEDMSVEDNDGEATIELYKDYEIIYDNKDLNTVK